MKKLFPFQYGIFLKLWTTFFIILIPIYVITFFMSKSGVDIIRQQVLHLMEQKSAFFVSTMDSEMSRISSLQLSFLNDSDLQDLSIRSESLRIYERTKTINDLLAKLQALAASSRYIKDAFVLMPNNGHRISSVDGYSEMNREEYERFRKMNDATFSGLVYSNNYVYFSLGFPRTTSRQYILVIEIAVDKIAAELSDPDMVGNGTAYIASHTSNAGFTIPSGATGGISADKNELMKNNKLKEGAIIQVNGESYLRFIKPFKSVDWSFVVVVHEDEILQPVHTFKKWLWVLSIISIVLIFIVSLSLLRVIHKPLVKLLKAFKSVESGQFDIQLQHKNKDEFDYLYKQFNQTADRLNVLVKQVYEQTIRSQKAELKQLQAQINPHFLYNSLYILYRMAQDEDYEGVSSMSKHLGDYFKFITHNKSDLVPLDKEIQHATVYCSIQQMRFKNRIEFNFDIEGPTSMWEVPRLIIQPLLENAIVHGHEDTVENGQVHIIIRCDANTLTIKVEDNGKGANPDLLEEWKKKFHSPDEMDDHALWNIHRRLQLRYGSLGHTKLQTSMLGGLSVTLSIGRDVDLI